MIEIIHLEKLKQKGKYKIKTNLEEYILDEDTIVKHRILKGSIFNEKEFEEILKDVEINSLFLKAITYLTYGPRSIFEMKEYLKKEVQKEEELEKVIQKLLDLGYLNDEQLAFNIFEHYKENKKGPKWIEQKLLQKKIQNKWIQHAKETYLEEEELQNMEYLFHKTNHQEKPVLKQKQMLTQKLLRDGYTPSLVHHFVDQCTFEDHSQKQLQKDFEKIKQKIEQKSLTQEEKKKKIMTSLMTKGYSYKDILECFSKN